MGKKLFIGGLSWGTTDASLHSAFERFGEIVEAKVVVDRDTGRSKGFGFVTFAEDQAAFDAISEMDGKPLEGRTVKVNEAKERAPRDAQASSNRYGSRYPDSRSREWS